MSTTVTVAADADHRMQVNEHETETGVLRYTYYVGPGETRDFPAREDMTLSQVQVPLDDPEGLLAEENRKAAAAAPAEAAPAAAPEAAPEAPAA